MRFTFEILAIALLVAAGSVLRPVPAAAGCRPLSAGQAHHSRALAAPLAGVRG